MDILADKIHSNDLDFLKLITNQNPLPNDTITHDYKLLLSFLHNGNYTERFGHMVELFNNIDNDSIKTDIIKKIAICVIKNKSRIYKYDLTLINQKIIDYMIKNNLFQMFIENKYKYSLFTKIFSDNLVTKVNFNITDNNINFFTKRNIGLNINLNRFIETQFLPYRYSLTDLNVYLNYSVFVANQYENSCELSDENKNDLYKTVVKLYLSILYSLYSIYNSNIETISLFSIINPNIDNTYSSLNKVTKDTQTIKISIEKLVKTELFKKICKEQVLIPYKDIDLEEIDSNILNILSYFTQNSKNENYGDITDLIYRLLGDSILNIHYKVKLINDSSRDIFSKFSVQETLLNLFIEIEKYGENSGFYDKLKTRTTIIKVFDKFYDSKLFTNLNDDNCYRFLTLFMSELNEILATIQKFMTSSRKIDKNDIQYLPYISTTAKYVRELCVYYSFAMKFFQTSDFAKKHVSRLCELTYSILNTLFNSRLYNEICSTDELDIKLDFGSEGLNNLLKIFLERFFLNLKLNMSDEMMDCILKNENFYDKELLMKTKDIFGYYWIKFNKSVSVASIIEAYCDRIDKHIAENQDKICKYKTDIPDMFIDPIMNIPIMDPVELPSSKTILDRNTITNHLVFSQTDPFNRDRLTLRELNFHNIAPKTIEIIDEFKEKFKLWKKENAL